MTLVETQITLENILYSKRQNAFMETSVNGNFSGFKFQL